jgi:hypothetical protein
MTSRLLRSVTVAPILILICVFVSPVPLEAAESCAELGGKVIQASAIGLPSTGARVRSAVLVQASESIPVEYCRVLGVIGPIDPTAPDINFQVNLPTVWTGKAVQYGGGGFNGTLITGENPLGNTPPNVPPPLAQGYATFGTDSGHQVSNLTEIQAFALNDEALINFAYASYKKTRDVAVALMASRYDRAPSRVYYFGGSEGGREGLTMAQRFPADYDGVVSAVPVISWIGLQTAGNRSSIVQQKGGWLNANKVALLHKAVLAACDNLDGLADGIISHYERCGSVFNAASLRCPTGGDESDVCLSDPQLAAVNALHSPYEFTFSLANGVTAYPGFGYGGEDQPGGMVQWVSGAKPPAFPSPPGSGQGQGWYFGNGVIRYFIVRDAKFNPLEYSPDAYADRVRHISGLMDSTNPDLSAFAARGGKLIIKESMADYAQSPFAGIAYYKSVVAKMSQTVVDRFFRLYASPGTNHAGSGVSSTGAPVPRYIDLLSILDAWVDKGQAPADALTLTAQGATPPFVVTASRPMCRYPTYPHYKGSGDPNSASSFSCVALERSNQALEPSACANEDAVCAAAQRGTLDRAGLTTFAEDCNAQHD